MNELARLVASGAAKSPDFSTELLLGLLPVGVYACDAAGRISVFNSAAAKLWGRSPALGDDEQRFCGAFRLFRPDGSLLPHDQTPMAEALRTGKGARDREVIIEREDGSRVWVSVSIDALRDDAGTIVGAINCFQDITGRKEAEQALEGSHRWLFDLLQALPVAVYTTDAEGRITLYNRAAEDLWGRAPKLGELWCGSYKLIHADGTPMPHDECPMAIALKENRPVHDREAILERPDGGRVPFKPYPTPLQDRTGKLVGAVNMLVDISQHQEARDRQQTLINELNHRVKNTLALVTSIARLTKRSSSGPGEFVDAFSGRLASLSRTHNLLNLEWWKSLGLKTLLSDELAPFGTEEAIELTGEDVPLTPKQGIALALIVHELATNAVKYGALSQSGGRLRVAWQCVTGEEGERVRIEWSESGGPPVEPPAKEGFGSMLLGRSVAGDLGGSIEQHFDAAGYRCAIEFPVDTEENVGPE